MVDMRRLSQDETLEFEMNIEGDLLDTSNQQSMSRVISVNTSKQEDMLNVIQNNAMAEIH